MSEPRESASAFLEAYERGLARLREAGYEDLELGRDSCG